MNLNYKFPPIFWATSRLMTESGALDFLDEDLEILYEEEDEEEGLDEQNKKDLKIKYFKMSAAINKIKEFGVRIELPNINTSSFTFRPDVEENTIYFGLKGLSRIGNNIISDIIANRPYSSIEDFLNKVKVNKVQMTMLIKAGAFDLFLKQNENRENLIINYCNLVADTKKEINMRNFARLIELDLIPTEYEFYSKLFRYNKHIRKFFLFGDRFVINEPVIREMLNYFEFGIFEYEGNEEYFLEKVWKKFYDNHMKEVKKWVTANKDFLLAAVNQAAVQELLDKYNIGNISYQEMESLSYYHHQHELEYEEYQDWLNKMGVQDFFSLPEEPQIEAQYKSGAVKMQLYRIAGTCIGRDKGKNIVGFLTPTGFLKIKVYRSQFIKYDKQIKLDGQIEKSWFSKGNKLLLSGYRNEDHFILKTYKDHPHGQAIYQIQAPGVLKAKRLGE